MWSSLIPAAASAPIMTSPVRSTNRAWTSPFKIFVVPTANYSANYPLNVASVTTGSISHKSTDSLAPSKTTTAMLISLRRFLGPIISPVLQGLGIGGTPDVTAPSLSAIAQAQSHWRHNTGVVSRFLSNVESFGPSDLEREAAIALSAELDELDQKAILDRRFLSGDNANPAVAQADNTLERQAKFQSVVDGLQRLTDKGVNMTPEEVGAASQAINKNRCEFVLPAIDIYFEAAAGVLGNVNATRAIRSSKC